MRAGEHFLGRRDPEVTERPTQLAQSPRAPSIVMPKSRGVAIVGLSLRRSERSAGSAPRSSLNGSAPSTRAIDMNSATSSRRSRPSYFATNDWGRPSLSASSVCVTPTLRHAWTSLRDNCRRPKWNGARGRRASSVMGALLTSKTRAVSNNKPQLSTLTGRSTNGLGSSFVIRAGRSLLPQ